MRKISKLRARDLRWRANWRVGSWGEAVMQALKAYVRRGIGDKTEHTINGLMRKWRGEHMTRYGQWRRWNEANRRRQRQLRALRQLGCHVDWKRMPQNLRREDVR